MDDTGYRVCSAGMKPYHRRRWMPVVVSLTALINGGCQFRRTAEPVFIANPAFGGMTIAVAPALNHSGSADFDVDRFADLMASELSYGRGISVVPVSRVLAALAETGVRQVQSPTHALEVAAAVGADAILVFAVTEYEPYEPPIIGISAQLYGKRLGQERRALDPVSFSRRATFTAAPPARSSGLLAQQQRVFDASHDAVRSEIRRFAQQRKTGAGPYGWRKYVVSQQHFIRFCCHAVLSPLLGEPPLPALGEPPRKEDENERVVGDVHARVGMP